MNAFTLNRIIGVVLILVMLPILWVVYSLKNRNLVEEAELAMQETLARWITPEMKDLAKEQAETRLLEEKQKQSSIVFWGSFFRYGAVGSSSILLLCLFILSLGGYIKLSTHTLKIGEHEIQYRGHLSPEIASGLMVAEQIKHTMPEQAVKLYIEMAKTNSTQLQALSKGFALPASEMLALPEISSSQNATVPSFGELLHNGTIARGKPLLIGYTRDRKPYRSELKDNYSTVVFGMSGTGKTTGEAYNIAQTILAYGAYYTILDPHYPDKDKESLGDRLGVLVDTDYIRIYNNPYRLDEYGEILTREFEAILKTGEGKSPHIIVVDEHAVWKSASNGGKEWLKFEERIIFEGRKYQWYLHVTSKSPLAQDFGKSAVRDNFKTSLMYQVKKHQAATYYKDPELVEMVEECKRPGMAVYTDKADVSQIVHVPMIAQEDMQTVLEMITVKQSGGTDIMIPIQTAQNSSGRAKNISVTQDTGETQDTMPDTYDITGESQETRRFSDDDLLQILQQKRDAGESVSGMAREIDFERTYFSKWLNGGKGMTDVLREKLQAYCQDHSLDTSVNTGEIQERNNVIDAGNRFKKEVIV